MKFYFIDVEGLPYASKWYDFEGDCYLVIDRLNDDFPFTKRWKMHVRQVTRQEDGTWLVGNAPIRQDF
jgi:hypothetical protein